MCRQLREAAATELKQPRREADIYIYIYINIFIQRWREGKLYKEDSERERERVCGLKVTFRESDALQAAALTTFTREI